MLYKMATEEQLSDFEDKLEEMSVSLTSIQDFKS